MITKWRKTFLNKPISNTQYSSGVCSSEYPRLIDSFWDVAITYWHFSSFENLAWYWVLTFLFTIDLFVNVFNVHTYLKCVLASKITLEDFFLLSYHPKAGRFPITDFKKGKQGNTTLARLLYYH